MMTPDRSAFLHAERAEVERLLADTEPDSVSRLAFEARLEEIDAELDALEPMTKAALL